MTLSLQRWLSSFARFGLPVALSCITVGCRPEGTAPATVGLASDTMVVASGLDIETVNELIAPGSNFNGDIIDRLFLQLFEEQPDYSEKPSTFAPRLATSSEWSEDHRVLTLLLRDDVTWSDGVPVTAEDVRWTWQAQTHPDVAWDYGFVKEKVTDVEIVDATTVRLHFSEAYANQLFDINEGVILPKHAWEKLPFSEWRKQPYWFVENLVTNGPFVLETWEPQQRIVLRRNHRYHEAGIPRTERVVFRILPDQANQLMQLLGGSVDMIWAVDPAEADRIDGAEDVELVSFPSRRYGFICWNTVSALFRDPEVRRALTLAMDRQTIIDTLWHGHAKIASSPILSDVWAHNDAIAPWPYDPEGARRILAAKGWVDQDGDGTLERGGERFAFELTTNTGNQTSQDAIVMLQDQLRRVGIEVRLQLLEINTLIDRNLSHDFDATLGIFVMDTSLDLEYAFHTNSIDNGFNYGSYSNPEVDRLIDEVKQQIDPKDALPRLHRLQEILHEEQPFTFLWESQRLVGLRSRIDNARPNALSDFFNLREWSIRPQS